MRLAGHKLPFHRARYRYSLRDVALDLGLQGFNTRNRIDAGHQQIIAFIEGNEDAFPDFRKTIEATRPENAEVSGISFLDFEGYSSDAGDFTQIYKAHPPNRAIHPHLGMNRDPNEINGNPKAAR